MVDGNLIMHSYKDYHDGILSYIKESIIFSVIKDMKKILYCIYSNYSDLNEFLNFSGFYQIMKDFDIFPYIINMIQIKAIFYSLSDLFKEQIIEQIKKCTEFSTPFLSKQLINFEIFCEALGISTFYIKDSNNSKNEIDKIFHLLSKMSQKSKDWNTIFKSSFKSSDYKEFNIMLEYLKEKYLNEFDEGNSSFNYKMILNSPTSFDDINNHD